MGGVVIASSFLLVPASQAAVPMLSGIGVAILLFLPLYWIQDRSYRAMRRVEVQQRANASSVEQLTHAVEDVQEQINATNLRLDEVGPATSQLITEQRQTDDEVVAAFMESPTWQNTNALLTSARRLKAIGASIGCRIGNSEKWLFFQNRASPARSAGFEPGLPVFLDFTQTTVSWHRGEEAQVFMSEVAEGLKRSGSYPRDDNFDASNILRTLGQTVGKAITFRHEGKAFGPIYAIANTDWVITELGLESLFEPRPWLIPIEAITSGDVPQPAWVGIPATPERGVRYREALTLASRFWDRK